MEAIPLTNLIDESLQAHLDILQPGLRPPLPPSRKLMM
jgi:hypothetical protein